MTCNKVYIPTTGINPEKFANIPEFASFSKNGMAKLIIPYFHNAGKVQKFIKAHKMAEYHSDYNWNGYGYADHDHFYLLARKDALMLMEMIEEKKKRPRKTEDDIKKAWARRLVRLTDDIDYETALAIAEEKLDYKVQKIDEMESRQDERYSVRRQKLIKKMRRENPLRPIKNAEHAHAILAASERHKNTNYESMLQEAHELAELGEIDRGEVQQYARQHIEY